MTRRSISVLSGLLLSLAFPARAGELLEVESDRFRLDASANRASFVGNVVAKVRSTRIEAATIEASYAASSKNVVSAVAEGDVRVTDGSAILSGPRVEYDGAKRTLTMKDARISDGGNVQDCEEIILFVDERRLRSKKCSAVVSGEEGQRALER